MDRRLQFDMRENPASNRRHDSRQGLSSFSGGNGRDEESHTSLPLSTGENHVHADTSGRPHAASPRAATGGERATAFQLFCRSHQYCMCRCLGSMEGHANVLRGDCRAFVLENTGGFERKKSTDGLRVSAEAIVLLDNRGTLVTDIGKGGRANLRMERRKMARSQYQNGCLFVRGKRRKMWGGTMERRSDSR